MQGSNYCTDHASVMHPVKMTMEEAISHGMQSLMEQPLLFDVKHFLFLLLVSFAASKMPVIRFKFTMPLSFITNFQRSR